MKKLTKSEKNKVIFGVCGGLGEYFERDPLLFRVLFVILLFVSGFVPFFIAYVIVALMMPEGSQGVGKEETKNGGEKIKEGGGRGGWFWVFIIFILALFVIPFLFLIALISYKVSGTFISVTEPPEIRIDVDDIRIKENIYD